MAFYDWDKQSPILWPLNEPDGILENHNDEDLHSILGIPQLNVNLDSDVMISPTLDNSSASASDAYLHPNFAMEPFFNFIPSLPNPNYVFSRDRDVMKHHYLRSTIGSKSLHKRRLPTRRIDFNQEVIEELSNYDPQLKEMMKNYKQMQQPISHEPSNFRGYCLQIPRQPIFAPSLNVSLCVKRFKHYLLHLRNNTQDKDIFYWEEFVSQYYALGAKKRWCFSNYENIELHTAGVFCPKSKETWCCELCGLKSGKGLEASFETFARLHKIKCESGVLDEYLYLDSPRAYNVSGGVAVEYRDVTQVTAYQTFRVLHKGNLRLVFADDLKISSWEFCIHSHDEYLQRALFSPQVNMLNNAVEKYQDIQNRPSSSKTSFQDLHEVYDMFAFAGAQVIDNMDLPLVNDLGYPKRFIRCLQIGEVVNTMKALMTFSHITKMGPIESLNKYTQGINVHNNMKGKQKMEESMGAQMFEEPRFGSNSGPSFLNPNNQLFGQLNSHAIGKGEYSLMMDQCSNEAMGVGRLFNSNLFNEVLPSSSYRPKTQDQASVNKLTHEKIASSSSNSNSKGKRMMETSNEEPSGSLSEAIVQLLASKPQTYSIDQMQEALKNSGAGDLLSSLFGKKTY